MKYITSRQRTSLLLFRLFSGGFFIYILFIFIYNMLKYKYIYVRI